MDKTDKVLLCDAMIAELDNEHQETVNSQSTTGNRLEVYTSSAANMLAEKTYLDKRKALVSFRNDTVGVSNEVEAYINRVPTVFSKIDVIEGRAKEDNSLQPLGGKGL